MFICSAKAGKTTHFSSELGFLVCESTICNLKKVHIKSRDRTPSHRVLELPKGDRGRPLLLGKYDELVQNHARKLRLNGGIINTWIVMSISCAVLMFHQKSLLREFGGPIMIEMSLAELILRRMETERDLKSVKSTSQWFWKCKSRLPKANWNSCQETLYSRVFDYQRTVDETGVKIVPVRNWTVDLRETNK